MARRKNFHNEFQLDLFENFNLYIPEKDFHEDENGKEIPDVHTNILSALLAPVEIQVRHGKTHRVVGVIHQEDEVATYERNIADLHKKINRIKNEMESVFPESARYRSLWGRLEKLNEDLRYMERKHRLYAGREQNDESDKKKNNTNTMEIMHSYYMNRFIFMLEKLNGSKTDEERATYSVNLERCMREIDMAIEDEKDKVKLYKAIKQRAQEKGLNLNDTFETMPIMQFESTKQDKSTKKDKSGVRPC